MSTSLAASTVSASTSGIDRTVHFQDESIPDRKMAALFGMYVGDATAMPVHWMYNLNQLRRDYGTIRGFVKPHDRFEGSIMNLSNTGGGGRGSDQGDIIGSVINHNKKKYWVRGGNYHYHLGLEAGENTLEAQLTRLLAKGVIERGEFRQEEWLQDYIQFMTTPGSHNDTCKESFFVAIVVVVSSYEHVYLQMRRPVIVCSSRISFVVNHRYNVLTMMATMSMPLMPLLTLYPSSCITRKLLVKNETSNWPKPSPQLDGRVFYNLMPRILRIFSLLFFMVKTYGKQSNKMEIRKCVFSLTVRCLYSCSSLTLRSYRSIRSAVATQRSDPMVACYIDSSYPALLFFAYKYADDVEAAILASANAGGENVARGSCLGALVGAAHGLRAFPAWSHALKHGDDILRETRQLVGLRHPEWLGTQESTSPPTESASS